MNFLRVEQSLLKKKPDTEVAREMEMDVANATDGGGGTWKERR